MTAEQQKIARNTSWFTLALVLQKVIAFVYFTYLARVLGAEDLGQYVFALSYMQIFSIIIDFGTNHFITREIAKDKKQIEKIASNVYGFKLVTSILAVGAALLAAQILQYSAMTIQLLYVAAGVMVIESFIISTYAMIRGFHTLKYESIATVSAHVLLAIVGFGIVQVTKDVRWLLGVLLLVYTLNLLFGLYILKTKLKVKLTFSFNTKYWKSLFAVVLPFALAAGFSKTYNAFDQVALSKLADEAALGFYAVAYKMTFALQFLPLALIAAVYPAMSSYYKKNQDMLNKIFTRAVYYLIIISLPLSIGIIVFAQPIVTNLYTGSYTASIIPLQILIASIPLLFLNFPLGSLLNAADQQKQQTINMGIALSFNVVLNLLLIPRIEAVGAALASSISTLVLFLLGVYAVRKVVTVDVRYVVAFVFKTLLAAGLMGIVGWWLLSVTHWLVAGCLAAIIYFVTQITLGTIKRHDIAQMLSSFKNRTS